jgi:23S rRNA pseudouridine1911/1915/1917 synthase
MLNILYEDSEIIVAVKPAGVEAQSAKRFAPDMVSEIKKHLVINKLCTAGKEPYVAVIHRLDKPVSGVMVYAKTKKAAAALSSQLQSGEMKKIYQAVACGKTVDNVENFVDYLKKSVDGNYSQVVDKGINDAKRAELSCETVKLLEGAEHFPWEWGSERPGALSLLKIHLKTGRHHQIRVQLAAHGLPLYGDTKYNPLFGAEYTDGKIVPLALCASSLSFCHPSTGKRMELSIEPSGGAFEYFHMP